MARRINAALVIWVLATGVACRPRVLQKNSAADAGTVPNGGIAVDAASVTDGRAVVDLGVVTDAGSVTDLGNVPIHGDAASTPTAVTLGGSCTVELGARGALPPAEGTLPAQGPYRPCHLVGNHDYSTFRLSADGGRVAALTTSGVVIVLDSHTLAPVSVLSRARGTYTTVALSGDGAIVAAGSDADGEVDVWRVADHTVVRAFDLGPTWPTLGGALALSADGTRIATVAGSNIVVAVVATGATRTLPTSLLATALFFVDDDRKLAFAGGGLSQTGTVGGIVELIDIETGQVAPLVQHGDSSGIGQLEASADGNTLLVLGHGELSAWDVATARNRVLPLPDWRNGVTFTVIGLSADGTEIAASLMTTSGRWFQRRRISDNTVVDEVPIDGWSATRYAWSSRAGLLVTDTRDDAGDKQLATIDTASPKLLANACAGRTLGRPIGFSADGKRLFVRGYSDYSETTVFDVATGEPIGTPIPSGSLAPYSFTPAPDGLRVGWTTAEIAMGMVLKRVYVADATGAGRRLLLERSTVSGTGLAILFSPDSRRLAVVDTYDNVLIVVDVETAERASEVSLGAGYPGPLSFTSDGTAIVIRNDHVLRTVRWRDGATLAESTVVGDYLSAGSEGTVVTYGLTEARAYRGGALLSTMPGIDDFCFGWTPWAAVSGDGSVVGLGQGCSRPWTLQQAPHIDVRETTTGALIQRIMDAEPVVFASDASMFADGGSLIWCR